MRTCGIFSQASHPILLGTAVRQMSNIHLLLLSLVVGTCVFFLHSCISAIFIIYVYSSVCASMCAECKTLVSWGPWESETAKRPERECGGQGEEKKDRGQTGETRHSNKKNKKSRRRESGRFRLEKKILRDDVVKHQLVSSTHLLGEENR